MKMWQSPLTKCSHHQISSPLVPVCPVIAHKTRANMDDNDSYKDNNQVPLGQAQYRWDDMDDSNNKYEWAVAAPSDEILKRMWIGWSVVSLVCGTFALAVFLGMIWKRQVRQNAFNVYILAIALPDFVPGLLCGVDCAIRAAVEYGQQWTAAQCKFQAFYTTFNVSCNSWMNALICWEIHLLLRCSSRRERYFPPTVRQVLFRSAVCLWQVDWLVPCHFGLGIGSYCNPMWLPEERGV